MKGKYYVTNTNQVPVLKRRATVDHLLVQKGAIAAVEVFEGKRRTVLEHFAVIAADRANVDHDIALGMPAEDRFGAIKVISPTGLWAIIRGEKGHPSTILGVKWGGRA